MRGTGIGPPLSLFDPAQPDTFVDDTNPSPPSPWRDTDSLLHFSSSAMDITSRSGVLSAVFSPLAAAPFLANSNSGGYSRHFQLPSAAGDHPTEADTTPPGPHHHTSASRRVSHGDDHGLGLVRGLGLGLGVGAVTPPPTPTVHDPPPAGGSRHRPRATGGATGRRHSSGGVPARVTGGSGRSGLSDAPSRVAALPVNSGGPGLGNEQSNRDTATPLSHADVPACRGTGPTGPTTTAHGGSAGRTASGSSSTGVVAVATAPRGGKAAGAAKAAKAVPHPPSPSPPALAAADVRPVTRNVAMTDPPPLPRSSRGPSHADDLAKLLRRLSRPRTADGGEERDDAGGQRGGSAGGGNTGCGTGHGASGGGSERQKRADTRSSGAVASAKSRRASVHGDAVPCDIKVTVSTETDKYVQVGERWYWAGLRQG